MNDTRIKEHMEVIGADGVHVGTVDRVENGRIKLTKADSGEPASPVTQRLAVMPPIRTFFMGRAAQ